MYKNRRYRSGIGLPASQKTKFDENNRNKRNVLQDVGENSELLPIKSRRIDVQQKTDIHDDDDLESSQSSVPPSQPPTQRRYLSQRSLTLCRTQSRTLNRAPNSYFEMVLMKSGADLDQNNFIVLSYDNVTFVNRLCNMLNKTHDSSNAIDNFIEGFRDYLNDKSTAIKLLTGCSINMLSIDMKIQSQDSIVVNILMVNSLQQKVIDILLDKVETIAVKEENLDDITLIPLILSQLKLVTSAYADKFYNRIIKIYESSTDVAKREILMNIEFVLNPTKHDDFVSYLLENLTTDEDLLNENTVQLFTNFYLSSKIQTKIKRKIIRYVKEGCKVSLLPIFVKFLLTTTSEEDAILTELISDLRNCLCSRCSHLENENKIQTEIFGYISQALIRSRKISDNWQRIITNIKENEFKPLDFLILLMMMSIREEKSNYIENLLRRWIKQGRINMNIVIETKNTFFTVLEEYKDLLFRILHDFLREKNQLLNNFSKQSYRILFAAGNNFQKKVVKKLVELICDKTISNTASVTLELLKNLNEKYMNDMQNYGLLLLPILDHISEMTLNQYRTIMEILCSISYPQPPFQENSILKDQVDMLVKKQIISQISLIKKQGIIGIVQLIYHISCTEESAEENIYDLDATYNSIDELPEGRGKLAATYITRVFSATSYCVETLALFYNEMAMIFSPKNKNKITSDRHFIIWLCDLVTSYFQNYFVVEEAPIGFSLNLMYKNCINTIDDQSNPESEITPIAINISGTVLKPSSEAASSVITLPPLFNLIRVLHFIRYEGSLESINAVLGCAVILPSFVENSIDKDILEEYNDNTVKKILDIYFHLINWYREIIGSFASQNDKMIRKKILFRLAEVIDLENTVRNLLTLSTTSCYTPPLCQFTITTNIGSPTFKKPVGKPKVTQKKNQNKKKNEHENDPETEGMSILATARTQNPNIRHKNIGNRNQFDVTYGPQEKYRQIDFNLMLILREKLLLKYPLTVGDVGNCIGLLEFKFILSDLVNKLESLTGTKKMVTDELLQYITDPSNLINDIIYLLPVIMRHFKELTEAVNNKIEDVDRAMGNADLFTDEFNYIKICHGLCLRLLAAIFCGLEFKDDSNQKLLQVALYAINDLPLEKQNDTRSLSELAEMGFNKFVKLDNCIIDLKSAVYLYNLCLSLKKFATNINNINDLQKSIRNLCKVFLCTKWYNYTGLQDKGARCNILIDELLNGFFKNYSFKKLNGILKVILDEINLLKKKDDTLKTFPNIHKSNFPMIFKHLCITLINVLNENVTKDISTMDGLKIWEDACEIQNKILNVVKSLDLPRNFSLFLKYSHNFLKIFLQHGLVIIEKFLSENPERVNELLKSLQTTTRFLHNLCCHSKAIKHGGIVSQIPSIRETVENLVFKVKAALAANKCSSVFWMGDLKNKDLHGDVILSQGLYEENYDEDDQDYDNDSHDGNDDDENANETVIED